MDGESTRRKKFLQRKRQIKKSLTRLPTCDYIMWLPAWVSVRRTARTTICGALCQNCPLPAAATLAHLNPQARFRMIITDSDRDSSMVCKRTVTSLPHNWSYSYCAETSAFNWRIASGRSAFVRLRNREWTFWWGQPFTLSSCVHSGCHLASSQDVGKQKPDPSPVQPLLIPHPLPEPSYTLIPSHTTQPLSTPSPMVYNYINPVSGEQIVSLLPPNHPEMICLQSGSHVPHTRFGLLGEYWSPHCMYYRAWFLTVLSGILAAVFWFPFGIGLCLLDRRVKCQRCGLDIDDGICS